MRQRAAGRDSAQKILFRGRRLPPMHEKYTDFTPNAANRAVSGQHCRSWEGIGTTRQPAATLSSAVCHDVQSRQLMQQNPGVLFKLECRYCAVCGNGENGRACARWQGLSLSKPQVIAACDPPEKSMLSSVQTASRNAGGPGKLCTTAMPGSVSLAPGDASTIQHRDAQAPVNRLVRFARRIVVG